MDDLEPHTTPHYNLRIYLFILNLYPRISVATALLCPNVEITGHIMRYLEPPIKILHYNFHVIIASYILLVEVDYSGSIL